MTVAFHLEAPIRQLPVPRLLGQLQRDHRPQGDRLQQVAEHVHGDRRVQAQELHAERRRPVRRQSVPLGRRPVPRRHRLHLLFQPAAADPRPPGRPGRRHHPVRRAGGPGAAQQLELHDHHTEVLEPSRAVDAQRSGAVHRCARAAGGGADHGPRQGWWRRCWPGRVSSATTARSRRSSRQPTRRFPSASRTSPRPSSCWRPPGTRTASAPRSSPRSTRRCRRWPRS